MSIGSRRPPPGDSSAARRKPAPRTPVPGSAPPDLLRRGSSGSGGPFRPDPYSRQPAPPSRSGRGWLAGIVVIVIAAAAAGAFVLLGNSAGDETDSQPTHVSALPETSPAPTLTPDPRDTPVPTLSMAQIVAQISPAVVLVEGSEQGSGILVDPAGYVLTSAHVVGTMIEVRVSLNISGERFEPTLGQVIGLSPCNDLAVIRLPDGAYPALTVPQTITLNQFDPVFALGYPLHDQRQSAVPFRSEGEVSVAGMPVFGIPSVIEHNAALNKGNSGGPLFDRQGNLLGINSFNRSGISYAIRIDYAQLEWVRLRQGLPPEDGIKLEPGESVEITQHDNIEKQCLRFEGRTGQTISLTVKSIKKMNNPRLQLFGPDNLQLLDSGVGEWDEVITITLQNDGVYSGVVSSAYEVDDQYHVTLTVQGD